MTSRVTGRCTSTSPPFLCLLTASLSGWTLNEVRLPSRTTKPQQPPTPTPPTPTHIGKVLSHPTCRHTLQALVYHTLLHSKHWFTTPFLHSKHWFTTPFSTPSTGLPHPSSIPSTGLPHHPLQALVYNTLLHSKHWFTTPFSTPSTGLPHPSSTPSTGLPHPSPLLSLIHI